MSNTESPDGSATGAPGRGQLPVPDDGEQPTARAVGFGADQFSDPRQGSQTLTAHEYLHRGGGDIA